MAHPYPWPASALLETAWATGTAAAATSEVQMSDLARMWTEAELCHKTERGGGVHQSLVAVLTVEYCLRQAALPPIIAHVPAPSSSSSSILISVSLPACSVHGQLLATHGLCVQ